jgi:hypothetical protein
MIDMFSFGLKKVDKCRMKLALGLLLTHEFSLQTLQSVLFAFAETKMIMLQEQQLLVAWILWNNRNSWVRNGVKESAKVLAMCALHMMGEWCALNVLQQQNIASGTVLTATQWQQLRDR